MVSGDCISHYLWRVSLADETESVSRSLTTVELAKVSFKQSGASVAVMALKLEDATSEEQSSYAAPYNSKGIGLKVKSFAPEEEKKLQQ